MKLTTIEYIHALLQREIAEKVTDFENACNEPDKNLVIIEHVKHRFNEAKKALDDFEDQDWC